jgi:AraC-like DNA-binding protein
VLILFYRNYSELIEEKKLIIKREFQFEIEENLNTTEQLFKELYQSQEISFPETPQRFEEIKTLLQIAAKKNTSLSFTELTDSLIEENFFLPNQDVSIYAHTRYLPALIHTHAFFEVGCLLQGKCTNYILNQKLEMIPGDICIIAPNTEHSVGAFQDDCLMLNFLIRTSTFEKAFFGALSDTDILSDFFLRTLYNSKEHPYLYFRTAEDDELQYLIGSAFQENEKNKRYKNRMLNSIVNTFFISLLRDHEKDVVFSVTSENAPDENFIFLLRYMQENYTTLTLSQLASFFNYSERQLQRIIKAYTGMNFSENIQKLKMKQAADLLLHTELSVVEIAERVGYSDVSNFRQFFKKYFNSTPVEYRIANK